MAISSWIALVAAARRKIHSRDVPFKQSTCDCCRWRRRGVEVTLAGCQRYPWCDRCVVGYYCACDSFGEDFEEVVVVNDWLGQEQ